MAKARRALRVTTEQPESFEDWLQSLPDAFVDCRTDSHLWTHLRIEFDEHHNCWVKLSRCRRCRTNREQYITASGYVDRNKYSYPDNYTSSGLGRMDRDARGQIRLSSVMRFVDKQNAKLAS